jgi:CBASS immunity sensor of nucleotide second messenger signals
MPTSASGARIQGDDYQHLFVWFQAIRLLHPETEVARVEIESYGAGNVDDLVVRQAEGPDEYFQVKYSVDASKPISSEWFTAASTPNGRSPLQRLVLSWQSLKVKGKVPELTLFTNRLLDPTDPILRLRSGTRATVGQRLQEEAPASAARKQLALWAQHAGVSVDELLEVLSHLGIKTDQGSWSGLIEAARDRMGWLGLCTSEVDVESGVTAIRSWVKNGVRSLGRTELEREIERRSLRAGKRYSTLLVEAIDHAPWPDAAQVRLDWVNLFEGDEPRARRQLRDPSGWSTRLRPEMVEAARAVTAAGGDRVLVRGYMRLPLWFLSGAELPDTRGHHVACVQRGQWWSSDATPQAFPLRAVPTPLGQGHDIAIGLSVTNSIAADVVAYCKQAAIPASEYVDISPCGGVGPNAIADGQTALSWAVAARDAARSAVPVGGARVHLFMSGPAGGALLLGHVWNRVGLTRVYEDLSPGYAPTFEIPG